MNRQILFRGRQGNIWYFGDLQHDQDGNTFISFYDEIEHARRVKPVEPETVGQFTGLTDKYSENIFEGDIVHYGDADERRLVAYVEDGFLSVPDDKSQYALPLGTWLSACVVCGNKYDNPGLITESASAEKEV